eukprot:4747840-Pyramimonas_sp.AAC.1
MVRGTWRGMGRLFREASRNREGKGRVGFWQTLLSGDVCQPDEGTVDVTHMESYVGQSFHRKPSHSLVPVKMVINYNQKYDFFLSFVSESSKVIMLASILREKSGLFSAVRPRQALAREQRRPWLEVARVLAG